MTILNFTNFDLNNPGGANGLSSLAMYFQRLLYKQKIYPPNCSIIESTNARLCPRIMELGIEISGEDKKKLIRCILYSEEGEILAFGEAVAKERKFNLRNKSSIKPNKTRKKQIGKINFFCQRRGNIVGNHSVIFTNNGEEIELKHKGFSRSIYAVGALKAALWLSNQKKGFFNMSDVLGIS